MTFDPNFGPNKDPELRVPPPDYRRSSWSWGIWAAILAVVVIAGIGWFEWGGAPTDYTTTSSTTITKPEPTPTPAPGTPAPPPAQPSGNSQP